MLRTGKIVKKDENPLMVVSANYEQTVKELAAFPFTDDISRFLACLVLSQTEERYKEYLLYIMQNFADLSAGQTISAWQKGDFAYQDENFRQFFSEREYNLLKGLNTEDHLEDYAKDFPELFNSGLQWEFYPSKKKGMLYLHKSIKYYSNRKNQLPDLQQVVLHFVAAQMLVSWESSCIHLGLLLESGKTREEITKEFCAVWPVYIKN